jgi:hypothetical protein
MRITKDRIWSVAKRKIAQTVTIRKTAIALTPVSRRVGQTIFVNSDRTCRKNSNGFAILYGSFIPNFPCRFAGGARAGEANETEGECRIHTFFAEEAQGNFQEDTFFYKKTTVLFII